MNRGSRRLARMVGPCRRCFNEAPIHESGKSYFEVTEEQIEDGLQ